MLHLHSRLRSPMVGGAHPPLSPAASQAGLGSEAARLEAARARERISPNRIRSFPVTQTAALAKIAWTSQSLVDRTRVANRASSKTVMQGYYLCRRVQQSRARWTGRRCHGRRPRESTHTILPHNHVRERLRRSGGVCVILSGKISGYCEAVHTGLQHMNQGSTHVEVQHMGTNLEQASHIWGSYTIFSGVCMGV